MYANWVRVVNKFPYVALDLVHFSCAIPGAIPPNIPFMCKAFAQTFFSILPSSLFCPSGHSVHDAGKTQRYYIVTCFLSSCLWMWGSGCRVKRCTASVRRSHRLESLHSGGPQMKSNEKAVRDIATEPDSARVVWCCWRSHSKVNEQSSRRLRRQAQPSIHSSLARTSHWNSGTHDPCQERGVRRNPALHE